MQIWTQIYYLGSLLVGSFVFTYLVMPRIIGVVTYKRLMDDPNERSSHFEKVPSLGGIAFFMVISIGFYFLKPFDKNDIMSSILPGLTILFFVGIKDDLMVIGPFTKLLAQLLAVFFVLCHPSFHIDNLHDFMGIAQLNQFIAFPLSAFIMMFIINAFNLIDGIDGLASMVGIVIFSVFGVIFFFLDRLFSMGICILMVGSLLAFLRFNLSTDRKIFMGDTGSLILGFLIACLTIRLFSLDHTTLRSLPFQLENLPVLVMAILIIPVFDTTRVFTIRMINGKAPFSADRNHIHHLLIDYLRLSHRRASLFIGIVNLLFIAVFLLLGINFDNLIVLGILLVAVVLFTFFFFQINFSYKNLRRKIIWKRKLNQIRKNANLFGF